MKEDLRVKPTMNLEKMGNIETMFKTMFKMIFKMMFKTMFKTLFRKHWNIANKNMSFKKNYRSKTL